jgi:hypothetical protein
MLLRYAIDMDFVIREIHRVLRLNGCAAIVAGDSILRGAYVRKSSAIASLCASHGLAVSEIKNRRALPDNRRYFPRPVNGVLEHAYALGCGGSGYAIRQGSLLDVGLKRWPNRGGGPLKSRGG